MKAHLPPHVILARSRRAWPRDPCWCRPRRSGSPHTDARSTRCDRPMWSSMMASSIRVRSTTRRRLRSASRSPRSAPATRCRRRRSTRCWCAQRARPGAIVVRLKGGDPFVFGRGGEEAEALPRRRRAGRGRPRRPSPRWAAAAAAHAPLTHRDGAEHRQLRRRPVQGPGPNRTGPGLAGKGRTLVIYMGVKTCAARSPRS